MNTWQLSTFIITAAFIALAFQAERVLAQRNTARKHAAQLHDAHIALKQEYDRRRAEFDRLRNVTWPRPAKRMPKNEVQRAFAIAEESPLWIALQQQIDDYLQETIDDVSVAPSATMTTEARTHLAGGVEHVRLLQKRLLDLHAAAQKVDTDIEAEGDDKKAT